MKNKSRIEKLEEKANVDEVDTKCICEFYPNYKGCDCKEFKEGIRATGKEPTMDNFYKK